MFLVISASKVFSKARRPELLAESLVWSSSQASAMRASWVEFSAVLPSGFKRIRHYGVLAPSRKGARLPVARAALGVPPPNPTVIESVAQFMTRVTRLEWARCPQCGVGHRVVCGPLPRVRAGLASSRGPPVE